MLRRGVAPLYRYPGDRDFDPKTARAEIQVQGDRCVKNDIEDVKVAFDMRQGDG
jgi:hypothetical protein